MTIYDSIEHLFEDMKRWIQNNPLQKEELDLEPVPGIPHTQEYKDAMRDRMMGNKNTLGLKCKPEHVQARSISRSRSILIDDMVFSSGRAAAKYYGVSPALIVKWHKSGRAVKMSKKLG